MKLFLPPKKHFYQVLIFSVGMLWGLGGCGGNYESQVDSLGGSVSLRINLSNTEVTDDDLEDASFPETIKEILLENTGITDRGVEALGRFESLEFIDLTGTEITGNALQTLMQLPNLRSANVLADNVEVKDIKAFQKYLLEKNGGNERRRVIIAMPPYE
ncbi:MAG: hypothetical protein VX970_11175 [Planctomycetota bacterium]|nr:hypothetical protein [Planctomycetota bacterium]